MRKILSWIHFLGCVGWLLYMVVTVVADRGQSMPGLDEIFARASFFLTTGIGIYLFIKGPNRELAQLEKTRTETKILQEKAVQSKLEQEISEGKANISNQ